MFNWKDFEKLKNILSAYGDRYETQLDQHHVNIFPKDLLRWMEFLKEDLNFLTLVEIAGFDRGTGDGRRFELVYHLLDMGKHQRLNLHLHFNETERIPSVISFYPHADWMEREQAEMLSIRFDRAMRGLLLPEGQKVFPLRKSAKLGSWPEEPVRELPKNRVNPNKSEAPYPEESFVWKQYDLLSPETMGLFEWQVCFDPVHVVNSKTIVGFHHQGIEKNLEGRSWLHVLQLVDSINSGAAPTYSIAWAKAFEEIHLVKVPERGQAIRMVMLELARIAEHLTVMFEMTSALRREEAVFFLDAREKIYELFEKYCGHRQGFGLATLGGVKENLPHGWIIEYQSIAPLLIKNLRTLMTSLIAKKDFRSSLTESIVNAQTVLNWGISGPNMRAAGLNFDLRKSRALYFYQEVDFDVPVGVNGSAYDRFLVRYEEIFQSLRIVTQVLDNLPLGEVKSQLDLDQLQQQEVLKWHYSSLEAPNGEGGFLFLLDKDFRPLRVKVKTPSPAMVQALPHLTQGLTSSHLRCALASLGIRRHELDR